MTTNYLYHPFLTDLSIRELTLLGEDLPFQYVHFANMVLSQPIFFIFQSQSRWCLSVYIGSRCDKTQ